MLTTLKDQTDLLHKMLIQFSKVLIIARLLRSLTLILSHLDFLLRHTARTSFLSGDRPLEVLVPWCTHFFNRMHVHTTNLIMHWGKWCRLTNKIWSDRMTWIGSGERARDEVPEINDCGLGPCPFCNDSIPHGHCSIMLKYSSTYFFL